MGSKRKLSDYSDQKDLPIIEKTDWSLVPEVIPAQVHAKPGRKTKLHNRKNASGYYPEETKIEAVALYATFGNCTEVARIMGIEASTIRRWKSLEWWEMMMRRVHLEKDEELDSKFTKIVDKAIEEINDRLDNGEFIYNARTGETVRVKPKMRDVAMVAATNLEKRQLLRGQPTSRSEKVDVSDSLLRLAQEFAKFTSSKTIDVEDVELA